MRCQIQEDHIFRYPKSSFVTGKFTLFECCKAGSNGQVFFTGSTVLQLTIWPQLILSSIALVHVFVLILALLLKSCMRSGQRNKREGCSSFNKYLIVGLFPDMTFNALYAWYYGSIIARTFNAKLGMTATTDSDVASSVWLGFSSILACVTANLYLILNAVFTLFLVNFNGRRRVNPPTLRKAIYQAAAVYLFATFIFLHSYCIDINVAPVQACFVHNVVGRLSRYLFVLYLWCYWEAPCLLIRSTDDQLRVLLAITFFRIIGVYVLFMIPGITPFFVAFLPGWETTGQGLHTNYFTQFPCSFSDCNQYAPPVWQ